MKNTIKKITTSTIKNAVKKALNDIYGISQRHNRIRQEEFFYSLKKSIERVNTTETEMNELIGKNIYLYYIQDYNQGTSKYPHYIDTIAETAVKITRITNEFIIVDNGYRIRKSRVIAYRLNRTNTQSILNHIIIY